jgi:hypothetical protein
MARANDGSPTRGDALTGAIRSRWSPEKAFFDWPFPSTDAKLRAL